MLEQESFWNAESFAVITDSTKPAMKWTVDELTKKGKKVYVVDMSGSPDKDALHNIYNLPSGVENAVIGVTTSNPADVMADLEKKGITGRCPVMYLAHGFNIHTMHRGISKLFGKY